MAKALRRQMVLPDVKLEGGVTEEALPAPEKAPAEEALPPAPAEKAPQAPLRVPHRTNRTREHNSTLQTRDARSLSSSSTRPLRPRPRAWSGAPTCGFVFANASRM